MRGLRHPSVGTVAGCFLLAGVAVIAVAPFGALAARASLQSTAKQVDVRVTVPPRETRFPFRIRSSAGTARNVTPSIAELRSGGHLVRSDWLTFDPARVARVGTGGTMVSLVVNAAKLPEAGTYNGTVSLRASGFNGLDLPMTVLLGARSAPAISPETISLKITRTMPWNVGWWRARDDAKATVSFDVQEATGDGFVDGLEVRALPVTEKASGDRASATAMLACPPVEGLSQPKAQPSTASLVRVALVPPAGTTACEATVTNLPHAGTFVLTIRARNARGGSATATADITVTDGVLFPLLVVAFGVAVSYFVALLRAHRSRIPMNRKTRALLDRVDEAGRLYPAIESYPIAGAIRSLARDAGAASDTGETARWQSLLAAAEGLLHRLVESQRLRTNLDGWVSRLNAVIERGEALLDDKREPAQLRTAIQVARETLEKEGDATTVRGALAEADARLRRLPSPGDEQAAAEAQKELEAAAETLSAAIQRAESAKSAVEDAISNVPVTDRTERLRLGAGGVELSDEIPVLAVVTDPPGRIRVGRTVRFSLQPAAAAERLTAVRWSIERDDGTVLARQDGLTATYVFRDRGTYVVKAVAVDGRATIRERRLEVKRGTSLLDKPVFVDFLLSLFSYPVALLTGLWLFYYKDQAFFGSPTDYIALSLWGLGIDLGTKTLTGVRERVERGTATTE